MGIGIGIGIGIGVGQARKGGSAAPLPGFDSTTYADYPTGLAATTDGKYFSVNLSDGLARYVWQRVSGAGELAAIYPVNYAAANAAKNAAGNVGGAGEVLPASPWLDAVAVDGLWYDGPLPNRVGAKPDFNLFGASRACDVPWFLPGTTTTYGYTLVAGTWVLTPFVAGPDGALKALRIAQSATTSTPLFDFSILIPPGRWTLAFDIMSNAGNQTLQYCENFTTGMSNMAVTSSWQTISKTFTLAAATTRTIVFVGTSPTAAAFDVTIDNIRLIPGSLVGSPTATALSLYRAGVSKRTGYFPDNTTGSPFENFKINRGVTSSYPAMSVCAAIRHTGSFGQWEPFLCQVGEVGAPAGGALAFAFGHNSAQPPTGTPGGLGLNAAGLNGALSYNAGMGNNVWSIITASSGPSGSKLWVDGMLVASSPTALTNFTARVFEVLSILNAAGFSFHGQLASLTSWDRQISDTEAMNAAAVARARVLGMGETYAEPKSFYIAAGDSITLGGGITTPSGWTLQLGAYFSPYLQGANCGIGGATIATLNVAANKNLVLAQITAALARSRRPIVTVLLGTNDHPATNALADTFLASLLSYYADMRAAGAKVVACTAIATNQGLPWDSGVRDYFNTQLRLATSGYDALCDFAADANLNVWSSTYWADNLHPNAVGYSEMAPIAAAAVNSVWV